MQRPFWKFGAWKLWAAAALSAGLLELPFPLAGPLPAWRSVFAWFGLVPLLWALLSPACVESAAPAAPRLSARLSLRRAVVRGQLLLGPRHHAPLWRYAALGARRCCCSASVWFWGFTLASLAWALCWCGGQPAARGWRWPPRRFCGLRWNWPPRALPLFPGTSLATRRWTTRW